ncbi:MAG: Omp85 family outer membrane protein [Bacteroidales bacterium]
MRKNIVYIVLLLISKTFVVNAQTQDSTKIKEGYNFGAIPILSYDSDFGLQYGIMGQINNFGKPSRYPKLVSSLYMEASWTTKGSSLYSADYKNYSFQKFEIHAGFRYQPENRMRFLGFNGYDSNRENVNNKDSMKVFYGYKNDKIMGYATGIYNINEMKSLKLIAGIEFTHIKIADPKLKDSDYSDIENLYDKYQNWGLIDRTEADGGYFGTAKIGLTYDTRTKLENPQKGLFAGVLLLVSPRFAGSTNTFYSLSLVHRQYIMLIDRKLTFAYRLVLDYKSKNTPIYAKNLIYDDQLRAPLFAFGGKYSARGVLRNRAYADAYAFSNFELRWVALRMRILKQNIDIGLNAFYDAFSIVKETEMNLDRVSLAEQSKYFAYKLPMFNSTVGVGVRFVQNENFVIGVDYARLLNGTLGDSGVYTTVGYLF